MLDPGELGITYPVDLDAGDAPATWTVLSGALPPGLTLDASTGVLSGTPTQLGSFVFTVRATNDAGSTDAEFTLVIARSADALAPHISTASLPDGAATVPYEATLLTGGTPPITFSLGTGSLPAGLALGEFTGVLGTAPILWPVGTIRPGVFINHAVHRVLFRHSTMRSTHLARRRG